MKMKEDHTGTIKIDLGLDMGTNIVNVRSASVWWHLYVKQHLSNAWSSIHEKVKQHWGWVEKSVAY